MSIFVTSMLKIECRDQLEQIMFFNPQQGGIRSDIIEVIDKYGLPEIVMEGYCLRIHVGEFSDVQTLFAFDSMAKDAMLIGVIVFVRADTETILVLHIAVREDYSITGEHPQDMLAMDLIIKLREAASRIKGVKRLSLVYEGQERIIPV